MSIDKKENLADDSLMIDRLAVARTETFRGCWTVGDR